MAQSREQQKAMMIKLHRLKDFEGDGVKFAVANKNETVIGTLIQSRDFPDEMEIRITDGNDRFTVRGHKSILDNLTREEFADKVERNLLTHRELKNKWHIPENNKKQCLQN